MKFNKHTLWYRQSAREWNEALPLGNGKIAAMVFGGGITEKIQFDDSTFWSGEPSEENTLDGTLELVEKIRSVLLQKDYEAADQLGKNLHGSKENYGTHLPLGNVLLTLLDHEESADQLLRSVALDSGIASTTFTSGGATWSREVFVSHPDKLACIRFSEKQGQAFSLEVAFENIDTPVHVKGLVDKDLILEGYAHESLHSDGKTGVFLHARLRLLTDGMVRYIKERVIITDATEVTILYTSQTSMLSSTPEQDVRAVLDAGEEKGYATLRRRHQEDVATLYNKMSISLGDTDNSHLPTDQRIAAFGKGSTDTGLVALIYQYGRYLLFSSSREDSPLPTHMGGIWNDNIYCRIDCTQDMHIDMNIQMQYWLAPMTGLAQCSAPLFRWLTDTLVPSGRSTAQQAYGTDGWVAHVVSNPWGYTALGWAYNWGVWAYGGVWAATLLWNHYLYTMDRDFLQEVAYPVLREAAEFVVGYQFYDNESGYWLTGPSYSPETTFREGGSDYFLSLSTTCDTTLSREIFRIVLTAAQVLESTNDMLLATIAQRLESMPPYTLGAAGQLQEWYFDFEETNPNHRHVSHLLGAYPFHQITPEDTPMLAKGVAVSIERRYQNFEITSWGMAMLIGLYARLNQGDMAETMLRDTFRRIVKPNLTSVMGDLDTMWQSTWELDGNTGLTSSISELFARGTLDSIHLLPALPPCWKSGAIEGLCLPGAITLSLTWEAGRLRRAELISSVSGAKTLRLGEQVTQLEMKANTRYVLDENLQVI